MAAVYTERAILFHEINNSCLALYRLSLENEHSLPQKRGETLLLPCPFHLLKIFLLLFHFLIKLLNLFLTGHEKNNFLLWWKRKENQTTIVYILSLNLGNYSTADQEAPSKLILNMV